ncbi:MAG: hypothetical protein ACRYHQ_30890 [Janthinobacterium lividum]
MRDRVIVDMPRLPLEARWCPGGTVVYGGWTIYGPDPARQLCRLLAQEGTPDGPLQFRDPEGRPVMFVWSLAALARRDEPTQPAPEHDPCALVFDLFGEMVF